MQVKRNFQYPILKHLNHHLHLRLAVPRAILGWRAGSPHQHMAHTSKKRKPRATAALASSRLPTPVYATVRYGAALLTSCVPAVGAESIPDDDERRPWPSVRPPAKPD